MIIKDAQLETVCGITSPFPENQFMEIAFAGKSNVGKSSLINGLLNRKSLARTSAQPGKTRTVNFYHVSCYHEWLWEDEKLLSGDIAGITAETPLDGGPGDALPVRGEAVSQLPGQTRPARVPGELYFVDLPGYGYASASEEIKVQWGKMIEKYLHSSKMLTAVFLLVDIRHEPSANDRLMYSWICSQGFHPVIIATKADKINRSQMDKHKKLLRTGLQLEKGTEIFPYSALTKQGREKIYAYIDRLALERNLYGE